MTPLVGVPIKPFGVAKARLSPRLNAAARSRLGRAVASHTLDAVAACGAEVVVVTVDPGVQVWARDSGHGVLREVPGSGLNGAAQAVVSAARAAGRIWAVVHADVPLVSTADIAAVLDAVPPAGIAIAPARDGGTTAVAGDVDAFAFSYGPGSAQRHLRLASALPHRVVARPGLALDLDTPTDLQVAASHHDGRWLLPLLDT